jgi:ADP-ribose pyrophosphatase YjhB (NUDIX family)
MDKVIMAAGGIVENENGEILLIYRKKHWDLPKGKLDENENLEECAVREVKEETGLKNIHLGKFIEETVHEYEENGDRITKKTAWYKMIGSSLDKLTPQTEEQIEEIVWVKKNELTPYMELSYPNIVHILQKVSQ